ncbi:hypothetical protein [Rosenbergiella australiborealis]|uniref:hypothetical protein n=1 Tax=Rosenbergiella australiborealis TaxID=1544696 RepID=UPI00387EBEC0
MGCQGWGRVDVMRIDNDNFQLLEMKASQGMTNLSLPPIAAKQVEIDIYQLVQQILE